MQSNWGGHPGSLSRFGKLSKLLPYLDKLGMCFTQVIAMAAARVGRSPWPARDASVPLPEAGRRSNAPAPRNAARPYPPESSTYRVNQIESAHTLTFSPEREDHRAYEAHERSGVTPMHWLLQVQPREDDKHRQGDDFLNDLELKRAEGTVPDTIRRHLKAVFRQRDHPTDQNGNQQRRTAVLQVPIPRSGHKQIRTEQQSNGFDHPL